jgi:hypothetical protein
MTTLDYGYAPSAAPSWRINFLNRPGRGRYSELTAMRDQGVPRRYVLDAGALIAQERHDVRVAALPVVKV